MVAGNSLGGYASLATAVRYPEVVKGVVLLNAAGRFEEVKAEAQAQVEAALPSTEAGQGAKEALREACILCPTLLLPLLRGSLCLSLREAARCVETHVEQNGSMLKHGSWGIGCARVMSRVQRCSMPARLMSAC